MPACAAAPPRHAALCHRAARLLGILFTAMFLAACGSLPPNVGRLESRALQDPAGTRLFQGIAALMPQPSTARNDTGLRLLGNSEDAYGSRLALIQAAEKTLDLQYYSIHYDSSTEELLQRLQAAAARGVRIRILVDDFNTAGDNAEVLRLDQVPGIQVRLFNPLFGPRASQAGRILSSLFDFNRIQQRMHNKVFIADNALAVAGGRNLGNEYFGQGSDSNFLDLDLLIAGRLVRDLSRSFDRYWNDDLAYPVASLLTRAEREQWGAAQAQPPPSTTTDDATQAPAQAPRPVPGARDVARDILQGRMPLVWAPALLLADKPTKIDSDDPDDPETTVVDDLLHLLGRARRDLLIVSPYFVPGDAMMKTFSALRTRGARVRVLTNSLASNDAPLAHAGYARHRKALLRLGVELYELRSQGDTRRRLFGSTPQSRASLHSKALVMDGRLLVVGSMNLDRRSALQNTELGIVVQSRALAAELSGYLEETLDDCYRVEVTEDGRLRWHAPPDAAHPKGQVYDSEPEASTGLKLMLDLVGPFAPDEML
ncbi:phospholipase D family protein [Xylophilus sp. ASV27]|uniref:phospholipase D family protein n=1 Tax=Xylophilus sp. ASV27 TaxID=2795129 RepID=UPI0018EE076A|nr:phospholipase D family protein [Xylophilus sp. ASV27]